MMIYNYSALQDFCEKNKIVLNSDYSNKRVNVFLVIEGKCIQENCTNDFSKSFRALVKTNGYCVDCAKKIGRKKVEQTCLEKFGNKNPLKSDIIKEKIKKTCLEKYGVEHILQNNNIQEKIKKTNLEKYGKEYSGQVKEFKEKSKKTHLERYGVEYAGQSDKAKEKSKKTNLERYGFEYAGQVEKFKEKSRQTCLKRYGVEHPNQNIEIMEKNSKNAYKLKEYVYPSGKVIQVQGTEPYALDFLIEEKLINENDIVVGAKNVPTIWYFHENGNKHRHYVDIFVSSQNLCIECKSTWTFSKKEDNIFLKQNAAKELGYKYEIWVYDGKGNLVEKHV